MVPKPTTTNDESAHARVRGRVVPNGLPAWAAMVLVAFTTVGAGACVLVMDADFEKYQAASSDMPAPEAGLDAAAVPLRMRHRKHRRTWTPVRVEWAEGAQAAPEATRAPPVATT